MRRSDASVENADVAETGTEQCSEPDCQQNRESRARLCGIMKLLLIANRGQLYERLRLNLAAFGISTTHEVCYRGLLRSPKLGPLLNWLEPRLITVWLQGSSPAGPTHLQRRILAPRMRRAQNSPAHRMTAGALPPLGGHHRCGRPAAANGSDPAAGSRRWSGPPAGAAVQCGLPRLLVAALRIWPRAFARFHPQTSSSLPARKTLGPPSIAAARLTGAPNIYYGSLRRYRPEGFRLVLTSYASQSSRPAPRHGAETVCSEPPRACGRGRGLSTGAGAADKHIGLPARRNSGECRFESADWEKLLVLSIARIKRLVSAGS